MAGRVEVFGAHTCLDPRARPRVDIHKTWKVTETRSENVSLASRHHIISFCISSRNNSEELQGEFVSTTRDCVVATHTISKRSIFRRSITRCSSLVPLQWSLHPSRPPESALPPFFTEGSAHPYSASSRNNAVPRSNHYRYRTSL